MAKVIYISSSGIRVFIATYRQLKSDGGKMILADLNNSVNKIIEIAELKELFEICPTVDEAILQMPI